MGRDRSPNVLLVVLDSVRAKNCSLYGAARTTTPFLESLAEEAVTYAQARAPSNWSLPSHVSVFTGLEAHEHRLTVHDRLRPGNTVFESLAEDGYETGLFTENGFLNGHDSGIEECFGTVGGVPEEYDDAYDTASLNPGPDGFYYADRLLDWTAERDGAWAACLNLMDAHRPFEPRAAYDEWGDERARDLQADLDVRWEWEFYGSTHPYWRLGGLESLYDGGIRQADAVAERVVETLRRRGELDDTLVVVCGDHGDGFGEPGHLSNEPHAVSHIIPMHEELLHVPLLVRPPGGADGEVCHRPAALTRFPSVVAAHVAGEPPEAGFAAERVLSLKQPVTADLRDRFEDACEDVTPFTAASHAVYTNETGRGVRKRYHWGDEGLEASVSGPGDFAPRREIDPATVTDAFEDSEADVREPMGGRQATEQAKEQLAALGYY
ncbi:MULTISPECIES: sulfatase [Halorubrum]|jgi:arylsulfatase A|uniref:Sulfatase N-terminal domain-containing protein n=1 Tax=Halorubrum tropicale TaxID=1765655 RepID=A0A0M9ASU5_9EURY|nr:MULTISPECIES: sulfatase [Halorubrum]KOX97115.1 hypothetical protein AMR74_06740 [Halorubrum tropicale]TKX41535.1 sulfatase [Halorubrum sp. ARQ200]TKX49143.1 sulfatase [Halorubrum sp. ASP121]TKX60813.1 sulfatase [Halorubrum sp. ASP1]